METPAIYAKEGPVGGDAHESKGFTIFPPNETGWRLVAVATNAAWAIDDITVTYERINDLQPGIPKGCLHFQ